AGAPTTGGSPASAAPIPLGDSAEPELAPAQAAPEDPGATASATSATSATGASSASAPRATSAPIKRRRRPDYGFWGAPPRALRVRLPRPAPRPRPVRHAAV